MRPHESLHGVEHLGCDALLGGDDGHAQLRSLPLVLVVHFCDGDRPPVADAFHDRLDDRPLRLERAALRDVKVELQNGYVRGISRSS